MITFVSQAVRNFHHVGAVWPSSPLLAKALAKPLRRHREVSADRPVKVLEVGAGTGAVTKAVLSSLGSRDSADVVELNPVFCESLQQIAACSRCSPMAERSRTSSMPAFAWRDPE
ncbi:MAG: hypothetical protein ACO3EP_04185 [Phycisphaerales bacterium]